MVFGRGTAAAPYWAVFALSTGTCLLDVISDIITTGGKLWR